jgi:hypothetical protein
MANWHKISLLIGKCYDEVELDKQIQILYKINSMLSPSFQLYIPSLITDDYVRKALDELHELTLQYGLRKARSSNNEMLLRTLF